MQLLPKMVALVACFATATHLHELPNGNSADDASIPQDISDTATHGDEVVYRAGNVDGRFPVYNDTSDDELSTENSSDQEVIDPYWHDDPEDEESSANIVGAVDGILNPRPENEDVGPFFGNDDAYWEDDSSGEEVTTIGYVEVTTPSDADREASRRVRGRPLFFLKWRGEAAVQPPGETRKQDAKGGGSAAGGAAESETAGSEIFADVKCRCTGRKIADEEEREPDTECEVTRKQTEPKRFGSRRSRFKRHKHEMARDDGLDF